MTIPFRNPTSKHKCILVVAVIAFLTAAPASSVSQEDLAEALGSVAYYFEDIAIRTIDLEPNTPYWPSTYETRMAAGPGPYDGSLLISTGRFEDGGLGNTDFYDPDHPEYQYPDETYFKFTVRHPPEDAKYLVFTTQFITSELIDFWGGSQGYTALNDYADLTIEQTGYAERLASSYSSVWQTNPKVTRAVSLEYGDRTITVTVTDGGQFPGGAVSGSMDSAILISNVHFSDRNLSIPGMDTEIAAIPPHGHLSTGIYTYSKELISVPGIGFPFSFSIYYSSAQTRPSRLGRKWCHNFEWCLNRHRLENDNDPYLWSVYRGDGGRDCYEQDPEGQHFYSPLPRNPNCTSTLSLDYETDTYTTKDHVKYEFPGSGYSPLMLRRIRDANDNTIECSHDDDKKLTTVTDTRGNTATFHYSGDLLTSVNYAGLLEVTFEYDGEDLVSFTEPGGCVTSFTYDDDHNLLTVSKSDLGLLVENEYEYDLVTKRWDANGALAEFEYDGGTVTTRDRMGHPRATTFSLDDRPERTEDLSTGAVTTFTYLPHTEGSARSRRLGRQVNPVGHWIRFNYDNRGNPTWEEDQYCIIDRRYDYDDNLTLKNTMRPEGSGSFVWHFTYDDANNLLTETNPINEAVSYTYTNRGQIQEVTDRKGIVTTNEYNTAGDLTSVTVRDWGNRLVALQEFEYDELGRMVLSWDGNYNKTSYAYDTGGCLLSSRDPLDRETAYTYDSEGRVLTVTEPGNLVTRYDYTATGKTREIVDPLGNTLRFEYDANGRMILKANESGELEFGIGPAGRVIRVSDSEGRSAVASYDLAGRRTSLTVGVGENLHTMYFDYDLRGRLVGTRDPQLNWHIQNKYNWLDLLSETVNARGQRIGFVQDPAGRQTGITAPSFSIAHELDENGNREATTVTDADGTHLTRRLFDGANRVVNRTDEFENLVHYEYDLAGNLCELWYSNRNKVSYTYDDLNRLVAVEDWARRRTEYTYDEAGNITETILPDGSVVDYTHTAQRLEGVRIESAAGDTLYSCQYTFPAPGRVPEREETELPLEILLPESDTRFRYTGDRLDASGEHAFVYDLDGNMTSGVFGGAETTAEYDAFNRLLRFGSDEYRYDGDGYRVEATIKGVTTRYVYDTEGSVPRILEEHDENGQIVARYVYGIGLISREDADGNLSVYHFDIRGNTIALTDEVGAVTDRYAYDPFGLILADEGATPNLFRFMGRLGVVDDGNGLCFARSRYYAPELMRFIQRDQFFAGTLMRPQSLNAYAYAEGNPILLTDPNGDNPLAGALFGVGMKLASDAIQGKDITSSNYWEDNWEEVLGAAVAGAIAGSGFGTEAAFIAGGGGIAIGNVTEQVLQMHTNPTTGQKRFDSNELIRTTVIGAATAGAAAKAGGDCWGSDLIEFVVASAASEYMNSMYEQLDPDYWPDREPNIPTFRPTSLELLPTPTPGGLPGGSCSCAN